MYTSTPGNLTISKLPALIGVPPIATKIFLFASMSREFRCQWPLVTPAALTGNGCADASAGTSVEMTQTARNSFFTAILRRISSSKFHICRYKPRSHEVTSVARDWTNYLAGGG